MRNGAVASVECELFARAGGGDRMVIKRNYRRLMLRAAQHPHKVLIHSGNNHGGGGLSCGPACHHAGYAAYGGYIL